MVNCIRQLMDERKNLCDPLNRRPLSMSYPYLYTRESPQPTEQVKAAQAQSQTILTPRLTSDATIKAHCSYSQRISTRGYLHCTLRGISCARSDIYNKNFIVQPDTPQIKI